jgi:hypothetical protein
MSSIRSSLAAASLFLAAFVATACAVPAASPVPPATSAATASTIPASPSDSVISPPPTAAQTTPVLATPGGSSNEAPAATLIVGGAAFPGEVGGFDFGTYTQSAPWLPAVALDRVEIVDGSSLRIELDRRATIAEWAASYAPADEPAGDGLIGLGSGDGNAQFDAPPPGDWVLSVTVVYGDGAGTGAYYWHIVVS